MSEDRDEGFLARWARRKAQAREGTETRPLPAEPVDPVSGREPEVDLASLPAIETMTAETDITGFLKRGVPAELQRLALRKMWQLDPTIAGFVEVAENQYDFNDPASIPGFGPLDPGVDLKALLAQAIGAPPAPVAATNGVPIEVSEPVSTPQLAPLGSRSGSDPAGLTPSDGATVAGEHVTEPTRQLAERMDPEPAPDALEHAEPPAANGRRRHGSALPV